MIEFGIAAWVWSVDGATLAGVGTAETSASVIELPSAERRRLNPLSAATLRAAERLVAARPRDAVREVPLVFGSADGDGAVLLKLLRALREREPLSPTQFHNSVHNAPAGYWSIGLSSTAATTAIAAGADTPEVALAEAGLQAIAANAPAIMVVANGRFTDELAVPRPGAQPLTLAAWCEPLQPTSRWRCALTPRSAETTADGPTLEQAVRSRGAAGFELSRWVAGLGHVMTLTPHARVAT